MPEQSTDYPSTRFAQNPPPPAPPPPTAPIPYGDPPGEAVTAEIASRIMRAARREKPTWFKRWLADAMVPDQPNGNNPSK